MVADPVTDGGLCSLYFAPAIDFYMASQSLVDPESAIFDQISRSRHIS